jgi:hypothetical protein
MRLALLGEDAGSEQGDSCHVEIERSCVFV